MSDTEKYANSNSSSRHGEVDKHKESKHREEKHQSQKLSDPSERRHRSDSNFNKDIHVSEKNRSHKADKDTRRRYDSRSGKSRHHPNEEPHQRSERSKSPPPENKGRSRERRQDKDRPERRTSAHSSKEGHGRDDKKPKTEDEHLRPKRSGSREQKLTSSKERGGLTSQKKGTEKKSEERRSEDDPGKWDKRCREGETQRSKQSDQGSEEGEETTVASKSSSESTEKSSVEENSPNRKLCFMETLNLTLSPVKKALLPADVSQEDLTPVGGSDDDGSLPDVEDMCVIDEVDGSELQDGCDEDVDANVAKPSGDLPKAQSSDETNQRQDGLKVEDDKIQSETSAAEKQREDDRVQTTSEHRRPTVSPRTRSPEENDAKGSGDQTKSTSDGETLDSGNVTDMQRSIVKPDTKTSSHEADCATEECNDVTERRVLDSTIEEDQSAAQRSTAGVSEGAAALESKEPPDPQHLRAKAAAESERLPQGRQQEPRPSDGSSSKHQSDGHKDADAVSSTMSSESFPRESLSLREAVGVLTQTNENASDGAAEQSSSFGCSDVSKVSSTTEETKLPDEYAVLAVTPKKTFSPGKRQTGREEQSVEPSSSVLLLHDEDSMMRTLSSLKSIPDAISPLKSPARIIKRNHVKSLRKGEVINALQTVSV